MDKTRLIEERDHTKNEVTLTISVFTGRAQHIDQTHNRVNKKDFPEPITQGARAPVPDAAK